jgi:hypothetical protein
MAVKPQIVDFRVMKRTIWYVDTDVSDEPAAFLSKVRQGAKIEGHIIDFKEEIFIFKEVIKSCLKVQQLKF